MSFSQNAATNIVPLLGRLVLAAAFIPAGFHKVWEDDTFTGEAAQTLLDLGIGELVAADEQVSSAGRIVLASYQDAETGRLRSQTQPATTQDEEAKEDEPAQPEEDATGEPALEEEVPVEDLQPVEELDVQPQPPSPPEIEPEVEQAPGPEVTAKSLHHITVMLVDSGLDWKPGLMAWAGVLTELFGGALILIGLLSRLWGLGLAVVMGCAFYLTTWVAIGEHGWFSLPVSDFNAMFTQLGLFVLAFGVLLTGPGAVSFDRALFRRAKPETEDEHHFVDLT
ncbi:MAG: DoxX family protein [Planctomycetota bacterium]|nr:DoxX family protein [Planctomycetota bacterium]MCZ6812217.1 DoxX family protein [Planctomycetota bacterium]